MITYRKPARTGRPRLDPVSRGLVAAMAVAAVALLAAAAFLPRRRPAGMTNPPGVVDRLDMFDRPGAWAAGRLERVALAAADGSPARLVLDDRRGDAFPRVGTWTSPEVPAAFGVTEVLPSWNVAAPPDTGLRLDVRVRAARGGRWSPWMYLASWGRTLPGAERVLSCGLGQVHVDYLALDAPADAYQVRAQFLSFSPDPAVVPSLRRVAVSYSGVVTDAARRAALTEPVAFAGPWARDLGVPYRTQKDAPKALAGQVCSPTSVSMVLSHWGTDRGTVENALAIYDAENEIFGNWGRAVARAGELGHDAWLARFRNWDQVKAQIAAGQPVIASIRFKKGEFPSAAMSSTAGHLIVLRGFTPEGDVIVNDPANREKGNGAIYKADELGRAWFDKGGVGYVIRRPG